MLRRRICSTARCQIFDDYAYDSLIAVIIGGTLSPAAWLYQGSIAGSLVMILLSNLLTTLQLTQPVRNVTQGVIMICC
jgi:ribose/xylose/arabinose/galactoside ABC-type transport system permease subunit